MKIILIMVLLAGALAWLAEAGDAFYVGTWKITSAAVAPSRDGPAYGSDLAEMKALLNKTIVIQPQGITGPRTLACKRPPIPPRSPPSSAFAARLPKDRPGRPSKQASPNEIDFHFLDPGTAAFGLNNYVYTLKKQ